MEVPVEQALALIGLRDIQIAQLEAEVQQLKEELADTQAKE